MSAQGGECRKEEPKDRALGPQSLQKEGPPGEVGADGRQSRGEARGNPISESFQPEGVMGGSDAAHRPHNMSSFYGRQRTGPNEAEEGQERPEDAQRENTSEKRA